MLRPWDETQEHRDNLEELMYKLRGEDGLGVPYEPEGRRHPSNAYHLVILVLDRALVLVLGLKLLFLLLLLLLLLLVLILGPDSLLRTTPNSGERISRRFSSVLLCSAPGRGVQAGSARRRCGRPSHR